MSLRLERVVVCRRSAASPRRWYSSDAGGGGERKRKKRSRSECDRRAAVDDRGQSDEGLQRRSQTDSAIDARSSFREQQAHVTQNGPLSSFGVTSSMIDGDKST